MFGIAAIVAFAIALILQVASVSQGAVLSVATFALIGFLCLALDRGYGWYSDRRRVP